MKLYLLSQDENSNYDTFDSIIVCAENESDAKTIDPYGKEFKEDDYEYDFWAKTLKGIKVEEIGTANESQSRGVILASFNAG